MADPDQVAFGEPVLARHPLFGAVEVGAVGADILEHPGLAVATDLAVNGPWVSLGLWNGGYVS